MLNEWYDNINSFTYNGKNSLDMGLVIEAKENVYGSPAPKIEIAEIPGRAPLILDNKTDPLDNEDFENFEKKYVCHVMPEHYQNLEMVARNVYAWLFGDISYKRLEDTYERGYYRLAYCGQQMSVQDVAAGLLGKLEITMTCQAFKYSREGEKTLTLTAPGSVYNLENFTAKPYIKIYASGNVTLYINNRAHAFNDIQSYIEIDSELMSAHKGDTLQNVKMLTSLFPKLTAGENAIDWIGNVSKIEIIPRWCCL